MKKKVLFICTHNRARSQMAEGYMNARLKDRYEAFSAGTEATRVHLIAVRVMEEIGIDLSHHRSKLINEFFGRGIGTVVSLCDSASEACPFFPGAEEVLHQSFPDPSRFTGTEAEVHEQFREVRDAIASWIDTAFG